MPGERLALFEWGVSSFFGWGVYGLNLMLSWADRTDLLPATLQPIDGSALDIDPLERRHLAPAFARSAQVQDGLRQLAGQRATSRNLLLEVVQNGLQRHGAPHGVRLDGTPTVGVAFLEDTRFGPDAAERLARYPLVVAGSGWNRDLLLEAGAARVELVLQGVDPSHFHPAPRRNLFSGRFVVFSGGKPEYRKGQDLVIEAFRIFARHRPDALLLAAWHSPWPDKARTLAFNERLKSPPFKLDGHPDMAGWAALNGIAPEQFIDLGSVPNRAMPRILRDADVGLFPNRAEGGTNLVAMECMACGVPAILSANTGHLDLVQHGNCVPLLRQAAVPGPAHCGWGDSSVDEIVAALERVHADRDAARAMGERGAALMAGLSWAGQMDRLAELMRSVIA